MKRHCGHDVCCDCNKPLDLEERKRECFPIIEVVPSTVEEMQLRAKLATELCETRGCCGAIELIAGIPALVCVKKRHLEDVPHTFDSKVTDVIPF